jgi:hypothetical protein
MISDLIVAGSGPRRSPTFTVAAIVTLALGIGANVTMFSIAKSVFPRPLLGYHTNQLVPGSERRVQSPARPACDARVENHILGGQG